jgi:hypothetical protein
MSASSSGCDGHAGGSTELRALALAALDRLEPALDRLCAEPPTPLPTTCAVCPVCALLAALRGERPELVQRFAEQAGGLVAALREAIDPTAADPTAADPTAADPTTAEPEPAPQERTASGSPRLVQRIPVVRVGPRR